MKIALLGSLPKGDKVREGWVDWKPEYVEKIVALLPGAEILHGDAISDNVGAELVVGHDLALVKEADLVVVDARAKIGAGTAQEMVIAKYFGKPVVVVIPPGTHHRRSNVVFDGQTMEDWIHPFLKISSDYVASSVDDAVKWVEKFFKDSAEFKVKDLSVFEQAIARFEAYKKNH